MKTIITVDPGAKGAIVTRYPTGELKSANMPDTMGGVREALQAIADAHRTAAYGAINNLLNPVVGHLNSCDDIVLYIENVKGNAAGCRTAQQGLNFGRAYGWVEMACMCLHIPIIYVTPQAWQKVIGVGKRDGRSQPEWKRHLKDLAEQRYPAEKITLLNCDAYLIMSHAVKAELGV